MEQTAVEWLENKCSEFETIYDSLPLRLYEYIQQAKEMEKQQIENAFNNGYYQETIGYNASKEYYNKQFKNK